MRVTQFLLQEFPHYRSTVWLAASKSGAAYQKRLVEWLVEEPRTFAWFDDYELHTFIYFLTFAEPFDGDAHGVRATQRLQALEQYYVDVVGIPYFRVLLLRMIETALVGEDAARGLAYLSGIEPHLARTYWGAARSLADETFEWLSLLARKHAPREWMEIRHRWILAFLDEVGKLPSERVRVYLPQTRDTNIWLSVIFRAST